MKTLVIISTTIFLLFASQISSSAPSKSVKHSHNGRSHSHPLPKTALNHNHKKGQNKVKPKSGITVTATTQKRKLSPFTSAPSNSECSTFHGAKIIAQDAKHTYLGKVASDYDNESIFNDLGKYGSTYNVNSIWNELSPFGSSYSVYSSFNEHAGYPPTLVKNGKVIGYVTTNYTKNMAISPKALMKLCKDKF